VYNSGKKGRRKKGGGEYGERGGLSPSLLFSMPPGVEEEEGKRGKGKKEKGWQYFIRSLI